MIKRKIYPSDVETYRGLDMGIRPECAVAPKQRGPVIAAIMSEYQPPYFSVISYYGITT